MNHGTLPGVVKWQAVIDRHMITEEQRLQRNRAIMTGRQLSLHKPRSTAQRIFRIRRRINHLFIQFCVLLEERF